MILYHFILQQNLKTKCKQMMLKIRKNLRITSLDPKITGS